MSFDDATLRAMTLPVAMLVTQQPAKSVRIKARPCGHLRIRLRWYGMPREVVHQALRLGFKLWVKRDKQGTPISGRWAYVEWIKCDWRCRR